MSTDTPVADVLISAARKAMPVADAVGTLGFAELVDAWRPVNTAANAMAEHLGVRAMYPFEPADAGVDQLDTAHRQIAARTERGRFHAVR